MDVTTAQYREDLEYLFDTVFEVHPKPDWRTPMARLDAERRHALAMVETCESPADLWRIAQGFLHELHDGHTSVNPSVASFRYLPISLHPAEIEGRVVVGEVTDPTYAGTIARGDVILAIDEIDVEQAIDDSLRTACYTNIRFGRAQAVMNGITTSTAAEGTCATVTVARPSGVVEPVALPYLSLDRPEARTRRREILRRRLTGCVESAFDDALRAGILFYRQCMDRTWCLDIEESGLALQDLPEFDAVCRTLFTGLAARGWRRLVIDIRDNGGGSIYIGRALYKYLTRSRLRTYDTDTRISRRLQDVQPGYRDTPLGLRIERDQWLEYPYGTGSPTNEDDALPPFDGEIVVLIDSGVFSAGEVLAAELRGNGIGSFVGEPTTLGGTAPASATRFTLPNTHLTFWVAFTFFYAPLPPDHQYPGVLPDFHVAQTLADFRAGRDTVMEFVRARWRS